jgi:hypothetical protein
MDRRFRDILMMDYATKNTGGLLGGQQGATGGLLGGLSNINHLVLLLLLYSKQQNYKKCSNLNLELQKKYLIKN